MDQTSDRCEEDACQPALPPPVFGSEEGRPSQMQRNVSVALASLGLRPEEEVVLHEGYSLDLVVQWRGERIGVEVDGPSHFEGREPNSATLLKRRQLRHLAGGWCRCRTGSGTRLPRLASEPRSTWRRGWTDWRTGGLAAWTWAELN